MSGIRYLSLFTHQPQVLESFYRGYFNMQELGRSGDDEISLTDGYMNLTIQKIRPALRDLEPRMTPGANHIGIAVDSIEETVERYLKFNPKGIVRKEPGGVHYGEVRIHDPEFMPISLSETGFGMTTGAAQMPKLLHIAFDLFDTITMLDFYEQVFGFRGLIRTNQERVKRKNLHRFMGDGQVNIALHPFYSEVEGHEGNYGINHYGFMVDDWEAITAEIGKKWPAAPRPPNRPYEDARCEDPDGNKIDIGETKGWEIDNEVWVFSGRAKAHATTA